MVMGKELEEVEIVKPRTDNRLYKRIVLKNSLEVLLISDPETDKCAASMDVGVGSFSDPAGLEGLAHFLEHMLFYASEKYPVEDSYMKYVEEHGGSTNAFTANENTNYHFDVNADCFEEALDRFAQFFIKPLMSPDATMREINAVNSENQKNLLSDSWRIHQLNKHLSAADHPYHKFSTGNLETLDVRPKARGVDTRDELIKFYGENYSSNVMHLVVYGKDSIDKLQSLAENKFQEIRNTNRRSLSFTGQPWKSEHLQILVKAVPIKQRHELTVAWPITPSIRHYKEAPCFYLSHLIGHEGKGSLFNILKTLGWATSLYAGETEWTYNFAFFEVSISLTDVGHEHMEDIVGLLFRYIDIIKQSGACEWIFNELSSMGEIGFHYQDKYAAISYVVNLAINMQFYPPHDWLVGSSLPSKFNPGVIQLVLDELNPNNVRIFWESTKFEGFTNMTEPWYGTAYSVEKITSSMIQQWMEVAPTVLLHLPDPNAFIPTDLSLRNILDKPKFPLLLRKTSYSRLWYKPDTSFFKPKARVILNFCCPFSKISPETEILTKIYTRLVMDYLNEYAYDAQVAHLDYSMYLTKNGFQVTLGGYNHKLRILLEKIIEKIAKFEVKPDRFAVIKELLTKEYNNFKFQQPHQQAVSYCTLVLRDQSWPWADELGVLPYLEVDNLAKFAPELLSRTFLECYVAGNIEPNEAETMIMHIEDVIYNGPEAISRALFPSQHLTNRVTELEEGISYYYLVEGLNPSNENSALVHYIQVHQDDFLLNVKLELFALIGKQAAFHQLRTVEQLGYIVQLAERYDLGVHGLQFIIQSPVKGPRHLDERVRAFLSNFESKLCEMSDSEFKKLVNALIDMKLEKHKNLWEESHCYWPEISVGTLKFDRIEREVAALKLLTQQELIDFFNKYIKIGAPSRRSLSVQVYGSLHSSEYKKDKDEPTPPNSICIDDIFSFRSSMPLYGSFK
ncbi:Insulysin [Bertholletia excelsa]